MPWVRALLSSARWERSKADSKLYAVCLKDVACVGDHGDLSVWRIHATDMPAAVVHLVKGREYLGNFCYATFPEAVLAEVGLTPAQTDTPDVQASPLAGKHHDLHVETAGRLVALARALLAQASFDTIPVRTVADYLAQAVREGSLKLADLRCKARRQLLEHDPALAPPAS